MPPKKKDVGKGPDGAIAAEEITREEVGVFHFADGAKYDGQVLRKDGTIRRHGAGVFFDGSAVLDGAWVEDQLTGEGTATFYSGATYTGTFYQSAFNGRGKYAWPDGTHYVGQWRHNRMHGEGVYVDAQGRRWNGRFYDGQGVHLVEEM